MNVLVTGCSRGIGFEIVKKFMEKEDVKLFGIARSKEVLMQMEQKYGKNKFRGLQFDLLNLREKWTALECEIVAYFSSIDIIINNAGLLYNKPFINTTMHEIERTFSANVFAPLELTRRLLPYLEKSKKAHIVNIGSMAGFQGSMKFSGISWYSASKAALSCITECLAVELKSKNIAANCLALGAVQTVMLNEAFPGMKAPVSPEEMASFICDFAMNGQKYFNGKVIPVSMGTV